LEGNTLSSFRGTLRALGSTGSGTDLFTPTKDFAFAGFGNFAPTAPTTQTNFVTVPEPSTWAMMLIGFAGLGALYFRARRRALAA
jgi:hypothetical protein